MPPKQAMTLSISLDGVLGDKSIMDRDIRYSYLIDNTKYT
jgi:hypothetical protein